MGKRGRLRSPGDHHALTWAARAGERRGDHRVAFRRYERTLTSYVDGCQKLARSAAAHMLPSNGFTAGLSLRMQRLLPFLADMPAKMARRAASAITLPTYPADRVEGSPRSA
jgi:hypothetical protein